MGIAHKIRRSTPVVSLAQHTKQVLRSYGTATSGLRCEPNFLIIGAKRGGTTSLYKYLMEHPSMLSTFPRPARVKGTYFFDENFDRGLEWYFSHFAFRTTVSAATRRLGQQAFTGEASPYYLFHPLAAQRAAAVIPATKVIALLRNPIDRADSHFRERRANNTEPIADFAEALRAEPERLHGEDQKILEDPSYRSVAHRHMSYAAQSEYDVAIQRWFDAFGRDNVLVERSEDLYAEPQAVFDRVCSHIGVDTATLADPRVFNAQPKSKLPAETIAFLAERLQPSVDRLEELLGHSMRWDMSPTHAATTANSGV